MKIVHVVYSMEMGGAEMLVAQLSRLQREHGNDVSICAYSQCGILGTALASEGIPVHVMGEAHPARTIVRYLEYFRRTRPDVVHCHNPAPTLQAAVGARFAGAACIVSTRHSLVSPPYDRAAEIKFNLIARFTDWIAGICEITCRNLRGTPLASNRRIIRVYNGVSAMKRVETPLRDDVTFTVLFVGRLAAVKDLGTMLRAAAKTRETVPNFRLWIVGDGAVRSSLGQLAEELGILDVVTFWGEQMDTAQFFSAADAVAMSSTSEGLPMSLLQGMSLGLPVVVTDVGGMKEVLELAACGIAVPVGDWSSMAEAFARLARDAALRKQLGDRALQAYEEHFTLQRMHESYERLYRSGRNPIP